MTTTTSATTRDAAAAAPAGPTLIAASTSIWRKHVGKFLGNAEELVGVIVQPVLWVVLFGVGMRSAIALGAGGDDYVGFMLPGIVALSAMGGAIGGGMVWLDERVRGILREYLVAPIPRLAILLGNVGSTLTKSLLQAFVILGVGVLMGAAVTGDVLDGLLALVLLVGYAAGFSGLALAVASVTDDLMAYHAMIMLLNLPVLFLSSALYPLAALPTWMKVGALANPTTYLVDGVRRTVLGASGELPLLVCLAVTSAFALLGLAVASRAFATKTKRSRP
jgi:ABC-2 type transport system permease protein